MDPIKDQFTPFQTIFPAIIMIFTITLYSYLKLNKFKIAWENSQKGVSYIGQGSILFVTPCVPQKVHYINQALPVL